MKIKLKHDSLPKLHFSVYNNLRDSLSYHLYYNLYYSLRDSVTYRVFDSVYGKTKP